MAIYHMSAQMISRSAGRSAVNAAAYRAAEKLYDERLGRTFGYERKGGVEHREILAPGGAPAWVQSRAELWNKVEAAETRKNSQVAREVNIALPVELTSEQQLELVRGYVLEQFVGRGMVADVCIHRDNPQNPHAHLMLTTREIGPDGFGKKVREWNDKELYLDWRAEWANHCNVALERAGHRERIDHRSFEAQGIELEPTKHIGTAKDREDHRDLVRARMAEHEAIAHRNGERIIAEPELALDAITRQRATFTRTEVGRWLNTRTSGAEQFVKALDSVMASPELVKLEGGDGRERYTTKAMLEVEQRMLASAEEMVLRKGHAVSAKHQRQGERVPLLSDDQRRAYEHIIRSGDLAVVQGYAGAGKSFMLGAAREAWEAEGYRVRGGALAGKAAEGLQVSAGIESRSLHAWQYAWDQGRDQLGARDVLVIDEAGMVGTRQLERVLEQARKAGAKVVLVGDTQQLQAIEAGAPMRLLGERVGQVVMEEIRRQNEAWQKAASKALAEGRTDAALDAYKAAGCVHEHTSDRNASLLLLNAWDKHRREHPAETQIMLAFRRADVAALNAGARERCRKRGQLGDDHRIETHEGPRDFATGDRIYFMRNDRQLGVLNGTLGTIEAIRGAEVAVRLDDGRHVAFDCRHYNDIQHGYAATVHKSQGVTVDRAHVLAGTNFDQHVLYVALSRHRARVDLHWSRETFKDEAELRRILGRERPKDVAVDYEQAEREARSFERDAQKTELAASMSKLAQLEDVETVARREMRMLERISPEAADEARQGQGVGANAHATVKASQLERVRLERRLDIPLATTPAAPEALEPMEWLQAQGLVEDRAHAEWRAWRDEATPAQQLEARQGRGDGAELFARFRNARASGQAAAKALHEERVPQRERGASEPTREPSPEALARAEARIAARQKQIESRLRAEDRIADRMKELDKLVDKRLAKDKQRERGTEHSSGKQLGLERDKGRGGPER